MVRSHMLRLVRYFLIALVLTGDMLLHLGDGHTTQVVWTTHARTSVMSNPDGSGYEITRLDINQPLILLSSPDRSFAWVRVLIWNTLVGYIAGDDIANHPSGSYHPSSALSVAQDRGAHAPLPIQALATTDGAVHMRDNPTIDARIRALVPGHRLIRVSAWATDGNDQAWYRACEQPTGVCGWIFGDLVTFRWQRVSPSPAALLRGISMWATYNLLAVSTPDAIVRTALHNHLTHIYVEVGRSGPLGLYGRVGLLRLLPVAHAHGLRVIAWVYPYLTNLPADVALTVAAARLTTTTGQHPDGVMADVEQNMTESAVRAYGQIVRALLGPSTLMGIATYPPQSAAGAVYPFRTAAASWDVIAPMDYWHLRQRAYSAYQVADYVTTSVRRIMAATGNAHQPIDVIGQAFNIWQDGIHQPTGLETHAAIAAARAAGALGIGFFEWNHASPDEWMALSQGW